MQCFMPYFALIIMFYHVKIACYHSPFQKCEEDREMATTLFRNDVPLQGCFGNPFETSDGLPLVMILMEGNIGTFEGFWEA